MVADQHDCPVCGGFVRYLGVSYGNTWGQEHEHESWTVPTLIGRWTYISSQVATLCTKLKLQLPNL